jgi:hypothetical protein
LMARLTLRDEVLRSGERLHRRLEIPGNSDPANAYPNG